MVFGLRFRGIENFEADFRQHVERVLTDFFGQLQPSQPRLEQGLRIATRMVHGHLLTKDQDPRRELPMGSPELQVRDGMLFQPAQQFEKGGQVPGGLQATGHLRTPVGIDHPGGNRLAELRTGEIKIFRVPAAKFSHD
ncbi:MAG: hypothetical protein EA424_15365 [Planctomycetaceae bacterium]|nr:MAG: hypothetical protein EA424_15365 [Planctomycetaceae bacterium]